MARDALKIAAGGAAMSARATGQIRVGCPALWIGAPLCITIMCMLLIAAQRDGRARLETTVPRLKPDRTRPVNLS